MMTVLIQQHTTYLMNYALSLTKDHQDTHDLYQDTVMKMLVNAHQFQEGSNFKAWSKVIMRNSFINNYRKKKKYTAVSLENNNFYSVGSQRLTVENGGEGQLNLSFVETVVARLEDLYRIPFSMYYQGYSYDEIAVMMSIPVGTIKSRLHVARKLLKKQLIDYQPLTS